MKDQQGKSEKTLRAYNYRLGFFLDFTAQQNLRFVDPATSFPQYVEFLRKHDSDPDDRKVHNIFETLNTFLRTRDVLIAGKNRGDKTPGVFTKYSAERDCSEQIPVPSTERLNLLGFAKFVMFSAENRES